MLSLLLMLLAIVLLASVAVLAWAVGVVSAGSVFRCHRQRASAHKLCGQQQIDIVEPVAGKRGSSNSLYSM